MAFYITVLGILLNFETIILIFLKSYVYYPMILRSPTNPFEDVLAGNLFSQFSVSTTVLLVVILDMKFYWYIIFAFIYGIIEECFLALGIYKHNWYRTWITIVMLPLAFFIAKIMYKKVQKGMKPVLYYVYIYIGLFSLYVVTLLWGLQVFGFIAFNTTVLRDPVNSRYFIGLFLVFLPPSIGLMIVYFSKLKRLWKASLILLLYAVYYISCRYNLVWIKQGLFFPVSTLTIVWMYLSILILDKLYGGCGKTDFK